MPRQSRGSAPARRPAPAPARPQVPHPQPQQARSASTAAAPTAHPPAPVQQSQGPGLFGQMASTAAGVAVGSSIGHAIGGLFSGGGSSAPVEAAPTNATANEQYEGGAVCSIEVNSFRKCMNENGSDLTICGWYLDQLKACQAAASRY